MHWKIGIGVLRLEKTRNSVTHRPSRADATEKTIPRRRWPADWLAVFDEPLLVRGCALSEEQLQVHSTMRAMFARSM